MGHHSEVIDLKAANGSEIPYLGFVELDLKLNQQTSVILQKHLEFHSL